MKSIKYTPGPWNSNAGVMGDEFTVRPSNSDTPICIRATEDNSKLIALAPELVDSLKDLDLETEGNSVNRRIAYSLLRKVGAI